jgi:DNA-directed RNA polymerase subunit RPC12/RpoP
MDREETTKSTEENKEACPDCGSKIIWYHNPGVSRSVCKNKCKGWKVITEVDHEHRRDA